MVNLNRNNSNWSFEERRKINENWDVLEGLANSTASGNNGLKAEVDQLKITVGQNTDRVTNSLQLSNQANVKSDNALNSANTALFNANEAKNLAQGIDGKVNEANIKSDNALLTANEANEKSEYVQSQLDSLVADGDSSAEVVQARNGKTNLRQRLDDDYNAVTSRLNQTVNELSQKAKQSDLDLTNSKLTQIEGSVNAKADERSTNIAITDLNSRVMALSQLEQRVEDIIVSPIDDAVLAQEVVDARIGEETLAQKIIQIDKTLKSDDIYFYKLGDVVEENSGGWVNGYNDANNTDVVRSNTDKYELSFLNATTAGETGIATSALIDFSGIEFLVVDCEQTLNQVNTRVTIAVSSNQQSNRQSATNAAAITISGGYGRRLIKLDVSDLSGEYYIKIHAAKNAVIASARSRLLVYNVYAIASKVDRFNYTKKVTANQIAHFTPSDILPVYGQTPYLFEFRSTPGTHVATLYYDGKIYPIPADVTVSASDVALTTSRIKLIFSDTTKLFRFERYPYALKKDEYLVFYAKIVSSRKIYADFLYTNAGQSPLQDRSVTKNLLSQDIQDAIDLSVTLPQHYQDEITQTINDTQDVQDADALTFAFITDTHVTVSYIDEAVERQFLAIRDLAPICDFVVHGGDFSNGGKDLITSKKALNDFVNLWRDVKAPVFIARGNHDDNSYQYTSAPPYPSMLLTHRDWYVRCVKPFASDFKQSAGKDAAYFYRDFDHQKIRVITLDANDYPRTLDSEGKQKWLGYNFFGYGNDQLNWLAHEALNFESKSDKSEWSVFIISHMAPNLANAFNRTGVILQNILNAYENGTHYIDEVGDDWAVSIDVDFTTQSAMPIIGYISGHTHVDNITASPSNNYSFISTTTAQPAAPGDATSARVAGTINEGAFDVVTISKTDKKIYLKRFGYGDDRVVDFA